jgi:adenylate kinase
MNIVLLGSPASGKGTQADLLCREFNLYHLATGDLTRNLAETDPEIKRMYDAGELIPQELITMHVINFLGKNKADLKDILFEGFPRFISQYEALDSFLKNKGDDIDAIISLDVSEEEAVKRISSRWICDKCGEPYNLITKKPKTSGVCDKCGGELIQRKDDSPESVKVRFQYYKDNTKELIDYLDGKGKLIRVNGERPIDEISKDLKGIVTKIKNERN